MTRRGAIIGAMLLAGGKVMAEQTTIGTWTPLTPLRLRYVFGGPHGLEALDVQFSDGTTVTFTEADLQRELAGPAQEQN